MQIAKVAISNYRNLDGLEVVFNPRINFLVGENELGKSNLLELFDILFNRRQFLDADFSEADSPIRIEFSLRLSEAEKGTFDDYFDPDDSNLINVAAMQESSDFDEAISFFWAESVDSDDPVQLPNRLFRKVNYVAYDSLKAPQYELTFYRGRGSGRFLRYLIDEFVDSEIQMDVDGAMAPIIESIQSVFDRVKPFRRQGLSLYTDSENSSDLASRVLKLCGGDGFDIQKSGYGIQFSTLLLLSILEQLMSLKQNKRFSKFEQERAFFTRQEYQVFREMHLEQDSAAKGILDPRTQKQDDKYYIHIEGATAQDRKRLGSEIVGHIKTRKSVSMILGLDEPEIHLHPFMQRNLIKYIRELVQNQDADFLFLLKNHFDIDAIDGQILIVSHSPTVLLDRYEHVIRFREDSGVKVVCGTSLSLDPHVEKHLLLNFPYVKEAFFSRCVIVVEGATEKGALPLWANKTLGDLDEYGISVVGVGGYDSVPPVVELLDCFGIPSVSIIDKDNDNDANSKYTDVDGLRTTNYRDFEEELFETVCSNSRKVGALFDFLKSYGSHGLSRFAESRRLEAIAADYGIAKTWDRTRPRYTFEEVEGSDDRNLLKAMFLSWMTGNRTGKSITLGRALGQFIDKDLIPSVYKKLFEDAKNKAATG
jgi:putative ATP-dependent endonuclease of OLD family